MKSNRRNFIKIAGLAGTGILIGCTARKPVKVISDMKVAYIRESTVQDKYNKFAVKATEEKFVKIPIMLRAIATAEGIHAANHKKVLVKLKGNYEGSPIGNFEVKSTLDNLQEGLQTETYEIEVMYPNFIKEAKAENVQDAVDSFTWAYQVEIQHQGYYHIAITAFGTGSELTLPDKWYVCPKCGGTYAEADVKATCYFDPTPKTQFFEFK